MQNGDAARMLAEIQRDSTDDPSFARHVTPRRSYLRIIRQIEVQFGRSSAPMNSN
jgi:hypothetical protein